MSDFKRIITALNMDGEKTTEEDLELIREMPLTVSVQGLTITTAMRTPGYEEAQAAGLCLGDGILRTYDNLIGFSLNQEEEPSHIDVMVTQEAFERAQALLKERSMDVPFPSGADDQQVAAQLCSGIEPFSESDIVIELEKVHAIAQSMRRRQSIHKITRSAHASFVYDKDLENLSQAEDVGRHNALDKALGMVFLLRETDIAKVVVVSCRMNKDVVRKVANAGISIIVSISRPTTTAVHMARMLNMTLALSTKDAGIYAFSGPQRLG